MSYRVMQDGEEIDVSPTIVHIFLGDNGAYQECPPEEAQGFCVKLPVELPEVLDDDGDVIAEAGEAVCDTVFSLPGKGLPGAVGEATWEEVET